jgi:hypothetical protein
VDGSRFDEFTQRLVSVRLTRGSALRGLAVSALTLTGMVKLADEASAGKRRRPVCHCPTPGEPCTTQRLGRKQRNAHLRNDECDYLGKCRSTISACAAFPIAPVIDPIGQPCSSNTECGNSGGLVCTAGFCVGATCSSNSQCGNSGGFRCLAGTCVPIDLGNTCTNNGECSTGQCTGGFCVECTAASLCGTGTSAQCCAIGYHCDTGNTDVCILD